MNDYLENNDDMIEELDEQPVHFFCKLTFGQFFTLMVLEIITLCFVFYLGARYGNDYLKLDVLAKNSAAEQVSVVSGEDGANSKDRELREMARDALEGDKTDLRMKVEEILARQQSPNIPPIVEPVSAEDSNLEESANQVLNQPYEPRPATVEEADQEVVKVKSSADSKFAVQVGSYPDVKEASYRVEEWKAKGYPAYMMIANLGDKGQWYRVRIGAFIDKDEAGKYLNDLIDKEEIEDAFVVRNEQ